MRVAAIVVAPAAYESELVAGAVALLVRAAGLIAELAVARPAVFAVATAAQLVADAAVLVVTVVVADTACVVRPAAVLLTCYLSP